MLRVIILVVFIYINLFSYGQVPPGYYDPALGLHGQQLQEALHEIIDDHNVESYSELWNDFEFTDKKSNGKVWDIYSDNPGGTPPYQYNFISDQCGNYSQEGDCYNREHSFPKSWFGGEVYPMYTDLFHIYPTDGWVNMKRGNLPYGETGNANWTSQNGSKTGNCNFPGYSGDVFEPIDEYKGDLARSCFYMATRYFEEDNGWPGSDMTFGAQLKPWAVDLLFNWHEDDPVSQKEINRNNAVFEIQNNRNPFIDHPEYVEEIWFYTDIKEFDEFVVKAWPVPCQEVLNVEFKNASNNLNYAYMITDINGRVIFEKSNNMDKKLTINTHHMEKGVYYLRILSKGNDKIKYLKLLR